MLWQCDLLKPFFINEETLHGIKKGKAEGAANWNLQIWVSLSALQGSNWFQSPLELHLIPFFLSFLLVTLTALILSRDALLIGYAFYLRYKSLPSPVGFTSLNLFSISQQTNAGNAVFKCVHLSYFLVKTILCWFL